jgi:hypothetical protein
LEIHLSTSNLTLQLEPSHPGLQLQLKKFE